MSRNGLGARFRWAQSPDYASEVNLAACFVRVSGLKQYGIISAQASLVSNLIDSIAPRVPRLQSSLRPYRRGR